MSVAKNRLSAAEEKKYRRKYNDLKKRIRDLEDDNDKMVVKLARTKKNISRLRVERSILFEKFESVQNGEFGAMADFGDPDSFSADEGGERVITVVRTSKSRTPGGTIRHGGAVQHEVGETTGQHDTSKTAGPTAIASSTAPTPSTSGRARTSRPKPDPNAPKRPANAFFVYCNQVRNQVKEEHGDASLSDMTKLLGQKWKSLSKDEKKQYYELYEKDKERYATELNAYQSTGSAPGGGGGDDADRSPSESGSQRTSVLEDSQSHHPTGPPHFHRDGEEEEEEEEEEEVVIMGDDDDDDDYLAGAAVIPTTADRHAAEEKGIPPSSAGPSALPAQTPT